MRTLLLAAKMGRVGVRILSRNAAASAATSRSFMANFCSDESAKPNASSSQSSQMSSRKAKTPSIYLYDSPAHYLATLAEDQDCGKDSAASDIGLLLDSQPLPDSLAAADFDVRPLVITESVSPFRIISVNDAWVGLCGYTPEEARGRTLGELLHGPDTDVGAANALVSSLLHGTEDVGTVLTNYDKTERRFLIKLRLGSIKDEENGATFFVGVLREISEAGDCREVIR